MRASKHQPGKLKQVNFVKAGEKIQRKRREKTNLLSSADDWQLTVDLETQLKFPRHIAVTSLRPDLILHSDNTKQCIIWELTVSVSLMRGRGPNTKNWSNNVNKSHGRFIMTP